MMRTMGHRVSVGEVYKGQDVDMMLAIHAGDSAEAVRSFREQHPGRPVIVALTGSDLYCDLEENPEVRETIEVADRLVVLQPRALEQLSKAARAKARVIYQSAEPPEPLIPASSDQFDICVLSHLHDVKDPLRAAIAVRRLPESSRVYVLHAGKALTRAYKRQAHDEQMTNIRYRWLEQLSHPFARRLVGRCRALLVTSRQEGGSNAISEAAVCGMPVLATRIPGNEGLLGADYPGFFEIGKNAELRRLMVRTETDADFYDTLVSRMKHIAPLFDPAVELREWTELLGELS